GTVQGQQTVAGTTNGVIEIMTDTLTIATDGSVTGTQSIDAGSHAFVIAAGMEIDTPITPTVTPITRTLAGGLRGGLETFTSNNSQILVNLPNGAFNLTGTLTALPPLITLTAPSSITEGSSGNVTVTLFGTSLSAGDVYEFDLVTANGTATAGVNYSAV